jgi:cystathionine beta-lyase
MSTYNFDQEIDRKNTNSFKWDNPLYEGRDILPMPVADMDFRIADELTDTIKNINDHGVIGYSIVPETLKLAYQKKIKEAYDWDTNIDWQVWIPGIVPGLTLACSTFVSSSQHILTPIPVYHPFHLVAKWVDRSLLTFNMVENDGRWVYDFIEFENQLKKNPGVFLFCNPHNPGGTVFNVDEIARIKDLCNQYKCMILSDEIHADLLLETTVKHTSIGKYLSVDFPAISFFATSKTYNTAGMGGAVAIIPNAEIRDKFIKHSQGIFPMLTRNSIEIMQTSLTMKNEWLGTLLVYLRSNHDLLFSFVNNINGLKMLPLEATYLAWIQYDSKILGDFQERLFQNGLHVLRGEQFLGKNFIRVNIACTKKSLEKAILIMQKTIDETS